MTSVLWHLSHDIRMVTEKQYHPASTLRLAAAQMLCSQKACYVCCEALLTHRGASFHKCNDGEQVAATYHCNVVGDELSDGDGELARGEGGVHGGVQCGGCHSILHGAHHVLPVLLTGLG